MRLIVVGASGLIGGPLLGAARAAGHSVLGTYASRPRDGLVRFEIEHDRIGAVAPDLSTGDCVFLLSAKVDPNWVHAHPDEARRINVEATLRCIDDVAARGAHLVFLSSEAVFGDDSAQGYGEDDAPDPSTLYARQKVEVEGYLGAGARCIVRTGWTVDWNPTARCPILNTYKALRSTGAKMATDNYFTVTDVKDIVAGLLRIAENSYQGILHLAGNPPISRIQLADLVIASSEHGHTMRYDSVPFADIPYEEPRPRHAWLRNEKAKHDLDLRFRDPTSVVVKKVALLDRWFGQGERTDDERARLGGH